MKFNLLVVLAVWANCPLATDAATTNHPSRSRLNLRSEQVAYPEAEWCREVAPPAPKHKNVKRFHKLLGWLGSRVVSVLDSVAEGPGSNRSRRKGR